MKEVMQDLRLKTILRGTGSGRCLLALAKKSQLLKLEKQQTKLAELIIEHIIVQRPGYKMKQEEFPELMLDIQSVFPKESADTYFIPYSYSQRNNLAKGKFINKYYSLRKELKSLGEISSDVRDEEDSGDETQKDFGDIEEIERKLNFLKDNTEPWETVTQYWQDTSELRMSQIQQPAKAKSKTATKSKSKRGQRENISETPDGIETTLHHYLSTYPSLTSRLGYTLFEEDFGRIYPDHRLHIYSDYSDFVGKVLKNLTELESKPPALQDILQCIESDELSDEARNFSILLSLCYLDTVVTVARRKKDGKVVTCRPTHPEIQEGVITQVTSVGVMETFVAKRYSQFSEWKLPVQPLCVSIGNSVEDTDVCYVILDRNTRFLMTSPQRALDICFKIIHALNAEYSEESYRLWMLIQKGLYGLSSKFDNLKTDAQLPKLLRNFDLV